MGRGHSGGFGDALLCPGGWQLCPEMGKSPREARVCFWTHWWGSDHTAACFFTHTYIDIPPRSAQENIHVFPRFLSFWPGVYRDPEETAVVMETAGAKTL